MGTQLIFTVGTNPLPIWVAWYHLKDKLPQPVKVRLVYTAGTVAEIDRLQAYCQGADFLDPIQTSDGDPRNVRKDIQNIANDLSEETNPLHIHYTGGTKVMAVETVAAFEATLPPRTIHLDTSYLDPRATSGPAIVNRAGRIWAQDARKDVNPCLNRIAELNGFDLGPLEHTFWHRSARKTMTYSEPGKPTEPQLQTGRDLFSTGHTSCPIDLEYAAYAGLEDALNQIANENHTRTNYELFHNVYVRRAGASDTAKPFELDVVAVLGYQIVVVSCTTDNDQATIKGKAMEAIIRARQLGGDEARAIVLCSADRQAAELIENEMEDEMGSRGLPLRVWGKNRWKNLPKEFGFYLRKGLYWV